MVLDHIDTPQIVFIEGIHGAGKSTLAKKIASEIKSDNPFANIYLRSSTPNPIDFCRLTFFSPNEYDCFLSMLSKELNEPKNGIKFALIPFVSYEQGKFVVNWFDFISKYKENCPCSISFALSHEYCDGKATASQYRSVLLSRWSNFARNIDQSGIYIFEGALFQHPLAELIGYYMEDECSIICLIAELVECIKSIEKKLFYISVRDPYTVLSNAAENRKADDNDWMQGFQKMISTCNYGVKNGLSGLDGAIRYCQDRMKVEQRIMQELDMPIKIIERD